MDAPTTALLTPVLTGAIVSCSALFLSESISSWAALTPGDLCRTVTVTADDDAA